MRRTLGIGLLLVAVTAMVLLWLRRPVPPPATVRPEPALVASPTMASSLGQSRLTALANEIGPDAISPIARDLNAANGTIEHDLEILNSVFVAWQTNFPHEGNPVGENDEITVALAGANPLHFAFIAPTNRAINAHGQLVDRWGTPFRFHQLSGTQMEIRSAGPDRKFATADDVQFAPGENTP